jgi:HPt (histidine-containing phosphotransfer) domain-containing protein
MGVNAIRQPVHPPRADKAPESMRKLLATLWEQNLPLLRDRCAQLEEAVHAAQAEILTRQMREEAISTAHKLAGSLGMFGYPEGTQYARRIEQYLGSAAQVDAQRLAEDVASLRAAAGL